MAYWMQLSLNVAFCKAKQLSVAPPQSSLLRESFREIAQERHEHISITGFKT